MIEDVIKIVERLARLIAGIERGGPAIGRIEAFGQAAEELAHRQIRLAVAAIDRGIVDHRRAVGEHRDITRPQIAMKQRGAGAVFEKERADLLADPLAVLLQLPAEAGRPGALQLSFQSVLGEEEGPVLGFAVGLEVGAEEVVGRPAVALAFVFVQFGQSLCGAVGMLTVQLMEIQKLLDQECVLVAVPTAEHLGNAQSAVRGERRETIAFG